MISLIVCSRISGNRNWGLPKLLDSLKRMSSDCKNFEVLVKFDSDDKRVRSILRDLDAYPFRIKHLIEPRGRGYVDLHIAYNRLLSIADDRAVAVGVVADDFEIIYPGWDEAILSKTKTFQDNIFILHCRPHPPVFRPNYHEQKFYLDFDIDATLSEDPKVSEGFVVDESPFWSKKLLDICGGVTHHQASLDGWTLYLEYILWHRYGINRTLFTDGLLMQRKFNRKTDHRLGVRWYTERRYLLEFMRSRFYKTFLEHQALNLFLNINSDRSIPAEISGGEAPSAWLFDPKSYRKERNSYIRKYYLWKFLRKMLGRRRASRILGRKLEVASRSEGSPHAAKMSSGDQGSGSALRPPQQ